MERLAVTVEGAATVIGLAVLLILVHVVPNFFRGRGQTGGGAMAVILEARLRVGRWFALERHEGVVPEDQRRSRGGLMSLWDGPFGTDIANLVKGVGSLAETGKLRWLPGF